MATNFLCWVSWVSLGDGVILVLMTSMAMAVPHVLEDGLIPGWTQLGKITAEQAVRYVNKRNRA